MFKWKHYHYFFFFLTDQFTHLSVNSQVGQMCQSQAISNRKWLNIHLPRRCRYIILIEEQLFNVVGDEWHKNS